MGQRLQSLGDRAVVACMDERRSGEADEIEPVERRPLAIELGEKAEHAAAETGLGKMAAGGREEVKAPAGMAARASRGERI